MVDYSEVYNAIATIFKEKVHHKPLFHYTNIAGFLLMMKDIQHKKCNMFPGHMRYQNDMRELEEGLSFVKNNSSSIISKSQILQTVKDELIHLNNNIYITCFCAERDLLEQWKYYGNNCGLSIEFDFNQCEFFFHNDNVTGNSTKLSKYNTQELSQEDCCDKTNDLFRFNKKMVDVSTNEYALTRGGISLTPIDVLYSDEDKKDILKKVLELKMEENMRTLNMYNTSANQKQYIESALSAYIPICKNYYFTHEKESRLLFFPFKDTEVMYREKNNRILPYLKCIVVNKDIDKYPIISVTVGPGNNQNLVFNAVINILDGNSNYIFISNESNEKIRTFNSEEELRREIKHGELARYENSKFESVMVYCSYTSILVYKSPIPFRD